MRGNTRQVFEALCAAHEELGAPPTIRQLVEMMGLDINRHLSSVYYALLDLEDIGLVEKRVPESVGIYAPMYQPDQVNWETPGGDGDEREAVENSRA